MDNYIDNECQKQFESNDVFNLHSPDYTHDNYNFIDNNEEVKNLSNNNKKPNNNIICNNKESKKIKSVNFKSSSIFNNYSNSDYIKSLKLISKNENNYLNENSILTNQLKTTNSCKEINTNISNTIKKEDYISDINSLKNNKSLIDFNFNSINLGKSLHSTTKCTKDYLKKLCIMENRINRLKEHENKILKKVNSLKLSTIKDEKIRVQKLKDKKNLEYNKTESEKNLIDLKNHIKSTKQKREISLSTNKNNTLEKKKNIYKVMKKDSEIIDNLSRQVKLHYKNINNFNSLKVKENENNAKKSRITVNINKQKTSKENIINRFNEQAKLHDSLINKIKELENLESNYIENINTTIKNKSNEIKNYQNKLKNESNYYFSKQKKYIDNNQRLISLENNEYLNKKSLFKNINISNRNSKKSNKCLKSELIKKHKRNTCNFNNENFLVCNYNKVYNNSTDLNSTDIYTINNNYSQEIKKIIPNNKTNYVSKYNNSLKTSNNIINKNSSIQYDRYSIKSILKSKK